MALSQALSTGVSGLINHQKAMDNIGNNLANINTTGFKKGVFQFQTLLESTLSGAMPSTDARGSINAITLGMGTQTGSINQVFTQGSLDASSDANHMAIYGNGFFVLSTGNGGYAYTRDGTFYLDADGYLASTSNGLYVQGTLATKQGDGSISIPQDSKLQNIQISIGTVGGMSKTSQVSMTGNLNSSQAVSAGLNLYGTSSIPTVSNTQSWMPSTYNSTDSSWSALQDESYVASTELLNYIEENYNISAPVSGNIMAYSSGIPVTAATFANMSAYHAIDSTSGRIVDVSTTDVYGNSVPMSYEDIVAMGYVPVVQEVSTINGGNVQTSSAFGITVPEYIVRGSAVDYNNTLYQVDNDYTYPRWFYESNGATMAYNDVVATMNAMQSAMDELDAIKAAGTYPASYTLSDGTDVTIIDAADADMYKALEIATALGAVWANGFQGTESDPNPVPTTLNALPKVNEQYPATLDTALENLAYYDGAKWTTPFANIKDGEEITVSFDKGNGSITATFVYNRPSSPEAFGNQRDVDHERSYTLEHFLTFMAGDVDNTASACAAITPAMYGAVPDEQYPDGNPYSTSFDKIAYEEALANVTLAQSTANQNTSGTGVMGLVDVPASISTLNGGTSNYDAPAETAGAFTRSGVSQVAYQRWDSVTGQYVTQYADSFNVSIVSNLGSQNALSNIAISYNNVNVKTMFSSETEYAAAEGGSAVATVTAYDSLGNPKTVTLRLALVEQDSNFSTWRWYADCQDDTDFAWQVDDDGEINSSLNVGTGMIRFDANGNYVAGSDFSETSGLVINLSNQGVDDPIMVSIINGLNSKEAQDLDFSALTFSNSANSFTLETQNGYPPGSLESYTVATDGTIYGTFSNGASLAIARLVLAQVSNENGLISTGNNLYYTTPSSGDAQYGYAEVGGRGQVRQYWLETSTVDMAEEFTKLISTERGYQANSRVITTADEMLQELLSMKR